MHDFCNGPVNRNDIESHIDVYGLSIIAVRGDGAPSFAYTIGLTDKIGYELIAFGLPPLAAHAIFTSIARGCGEVPPATDTPDDRWANLPVMFKEADERVHHYVYQADYFYGRKVRVLQMVMTDREGRMPDQEGYDHTYMDIRQPLLY